MFYGFYAVCNAHPCHTKQPLVARKIPVSYSQCYSRIIVTSLLVGRLGHEAFIGGHEFSGVWRWDGLHKGRITNRDWSPGEPNNHEGRAEDCLMAWANGRWNDGQCGNRRFYICERRP